MITSGSERGGITSGSEPIRGPGSRAYTGPGFTGDTGAGVSGDTMPAAVLCAPEEPGLRSLLVSRNPHAHPHPHPSVIYQELMEISLAFTDIARAAASSREAAAATAS